MITKIFKTPRFRIFPVCLQLLLFSFFTLFSDTSHAKQLSITSDGSLGTNISIAGSNYTISDGKIRGGNQFHSFGQFNVFEGESATFTGPNSINNIIGRVTGKSHSYINGLLGLEINGANLYLLNPSGVIFGPNAELNLSGSFHVSTADYLSLGDNGIFYAAISENSVLTMDPPSAFGFLGGNPVGISIDESWLEVPEGETISVVGGDIAIEKANLIASGGRINIASVASAGEVILNTDKDSNLKMDSFDRLCNIDLSYARIDAGGAGGGTVVIRAGRFMTNSSSVSANVKENDSGEGGEGIDINVKGDVVLENSQIAANVDEGVKTGSGGIRISADSLEMADTEISSETFGEGQGGNISLTVNENVSIKGSGAGIFTNTFGSGHGGNIDITAASLEMMNGAEIQAATAGTEDAGDVKIDVDYLEIKDRSHIFASTFNKDGKGGDIEIMADNIYISGPEKSSDPFGPNFTGISTSSQEMGGPGGQLRITATDKLTLTNRSIIMSNSFGAGQAGGVKIKSGNLEIFNGAQIQSIAAGTGAGGDIEIEADSLLLSGVNPDPFISNVTGLKVIAPSTIASLTIGWGKAGSVTIKDVNSLTVLDGAKIDARTFGQKSAGNIEIHADNIVISGANEEAKKFLPEVGVSLLASRSSISTSSDRLLWGDNVTGDGGELVIHAKELKVLDEGLINSETQGRGAGGQIAINADRITLAGDAQIRAASSSESLGAGEAGNIHITSKDEFMMEDSRILTEAKISDGGNIKINNDHMVMLIDGEISSSVGGGPETVGGNVNIDPEFVILQNSKIIANAFEGKGGDIDIVTDVFLADSDSIIDASSDRGIDGTVDIRAAFSYLSENPATLSEDFRSAVELLREPCLARMQGGKYNSLVVSGRDAFPVEPGGLTPSPAYVR